MRSTNWSASTRNQGKEARAFPVFRFRRSSPEAIKGPASPFTELPEEIKNQRPSFGRLVQKVFNFLFLLILGLVLVGLVLAFAYQLVHSPEKLQAQATSLVKPVYDFIQGLIAAAK
jgi:D-alanyl-lipoteichoic acid acyltransferase DltB (MBOAT superfamily)